MLEILKKINSFKISSPLNSDRTIKFEDPFKDFEFDEISVRDNKLLLHKKGTVLARLAYVDGFLSGPDSRGGYTVIRPDKNDLEQFKEYFKVDRKDSLGIDTKIDDIKADIVVISDNPAINNPLKFQIIKPGKSLFEVYDKAFKDGAKYVLNMNSQQVPENSLKLLYLMAEKYIKDEVGAVQLRSLKDSDKTDAISTETGDWVAFAISADVWVKIKSKMANRDLNFYGNLKNQFKEKRLKRLSPDICRIKNTVKGDQNRKSFKIYEQ